MKTLPFISLFLGLVLGCGKSQEPSPSERIATVAFKTPSQSITLWIGESEALPLTVELKDTQGQVITNYVGTTMYYANGQSLSSATFVPTIEGTYILKAKVESIETIVPLTITVKNPQKELDKVVITSGFYQKYAVWHTMTGTKPELSAKGYDKVGTEVPIQKGLKANLGSSSVTISNLSFDKAGTQKIVIIAYGKQAEVTFEVRTPRTFEVVKVPLMFHFCLPGSYQYPNSTDTEVTMRTKALEALKNPDYINLLNQVFRNQYEADIASHDPNAQDTYIEFYLAETDPDGKPLAQKGVNLLSFAKPQQTGSTYDWSTPEATLYRQKVEQLIKRWNPNQYLNIIFEPTATNYGYGGGAAGGGGLDASRKDWVPREFFSLPIINYGGWGTFYNSANAPLISLNGFAQFFWAGQTSGTRIATTLPHEIGHILGLPHTFGSSSRCTDNVHSDGFLDTPTSFFESSTSNCEGVGFTQRNVMSYLNNGLKAYFTYDQVTMMRARIEAGFNLPTPRNRGKPYSNQVSVPEVYSFGGMAMPPCQHQPIP
ncbi:MAG: M43 family zinc metalloprotease [Spirosomataceae bacterium]